MVRKRMLPPPRVESTQPRETTPEPYSSGEETAGEGVLDEDEDDLGGTGGVVQGGMGSVDMNMNVGMLLDDERDWIDEDDDADEEEDLLELEYHPAFVSNVDKRRRRWETRWEALVEAVRIFLSSFHFSFLEDV
jgi:hypothetical protein